MKLLRLQFITKNIFILKQSFVFKTTLFLSVSKTYFCFSKYKFQLVNSKMCLTIRIYRKKPTRQKFKDKQSTKISKLNQITILFSKVDNNIFLPLNICCFPKYSKYTQFFGTFLKIFIV